MKDKGTGAENLIWLASRQGGRAHPSSLAADDILAGLTGRIAELEARVSAILAEVEPEPLRVDSESGRALTAPKADLGRSADKMSRDASVAADDELTRASEERRMLANEMRLLREAFQEARRSQLSAGAGANATQGQIAPDLRAAIADEMRSLLTELLADFRDRAAPPPPSAAVAESTEAAVAASQVPEQLVEDVDTVAPVADRAAAVEAPIETVESVIEPVGEVVRPAFTEPIVDEYVEELRASEPIAPTNALEVSATEPATQIVDDYVEELRAIETVAPTDAVEVDAAPPEPARPSVDEHVFEPAEPPLEAIDLAAPPVEPILEEVVELFQTEAPASFETIDVSPSPAEPEPSVDQYVEELRASEPIEPMIVDEYVAPPEPTSLTITPPVPPPVDARIDALWDAWSPTKDADSPPLAPAQPASFTTEEFIADPRSLDISETPADPPSALTPEQSLEFAPEPPVQFVPEPPLEFAPEPPATFAPETPASFAIEPPAIIEPEPATESAFTGEPVAETTSYSAFPELTAADERGLHQIQIVISPIHSFPRLLETERRIRSLSTVNALHLRDFRNGIATFVVAVAEAISPAEFGAVIQMLQNLHLRLEGTTQSSVELRAEDEPQTS